MAPLRNAVGLIDGDEGEVRRLQPVEALQECFRGDVEEVELTPLDIAPEKILFRAEEPGIERRRLHAGLSERRHLVFHERNEGRDDEANARTRQRRNLVAERLASARRHQDEGVISRDHMLDNFLLPPAEGVIAVNCLQDGEWVYRHGKSQICKNVAFLNSRSSAVEAAPADA